MKSYSSQPNQSSVLQKPLPAKKSFGQHFLTNPRVLSRIIDGAEIQPTETILEIGPGTGILTRELLEKARRVVATEVDRDLMEGLRKTFAGVKNFVLLEQNALTYEPDFPEYKIVANIPYNISGHFFRHFLEEVSYRPSKMVVLVQREVAEKACAQAGDMNILGLGVQVFGSPKIVMKVSPGSFSPPPKVDSAVLMIDVYDRPLLPEKDISKFFSVVRSVFQKKRKQLGVSLRGVILEDVLKQIPAEQLKRRPEELGVEEWIQLFYKLRNES